MSRLIRQNKATYEQNIVLNANEKQFYRFVRNSSTTHVPVPVLKSSNGNLCDDLTEISEIFASKFESVYTLADTSKLPQLSSLDLSEHLTNIIFEDNTVKHHLLTLNSTSASGIDSLFSFLLKLLDI